MKFIHIKDNNLFNDFVENHQLGNELQTTYWGKFKSLFEWDYDTVGIEDDNHNIIAAAMILKRKIPCLKYNILYAPRGFVIEYEDKTIVEAFVKHIRQYAQKNAAIFVKIDPCIKKNKRNKEGEMIKSDKNSKQIINHLKKLGFRQQSSGLGFENIQPRFVFELDIKNKSLDEIFNNFHSKTRYNIRLAARKGITIYEGSREDLVEFERIMKITGQRDGFITRPLSYFEKLYDTLEQKGKMKLFIAKYNYKEGINNIDEEIKQLEKKKTIDTEKIKKLNLKKEELNEALNHNPDGIIVAGTIVLLTKKRACYLYGASDNIYRNLMPNYLIQWEMIKYAHQQKCETYDFRGVSGDLSPENPLYGLYKFKKGFNGELVEYIGEFDLVFNKILYKIWTFWIPKIKKILKKSK
ncbi:peptidoglycan pentaglycine glycine transferase (the first glycine) [Natranaerovirga hydrolytica]|uniref:Peptidoglycan pentaglycine glycine transferase (The first glycine) n=1 Tax=Natranaerovirga hydrolytica TaxID=680378 RepID=A0A4R1MZ46_9FIRM|nr:lipid II:glycine glycyltransferase FemX [Natranaerovirga hydrolytica]TCK97880.1 peptidoglycan pentaglycine glycine transferase (the first glycine) [Natranaerovirga hydrolytica]